MENTKAEQLDILSEDEIKEFLDSLSKKERKSYEIAKSHLGMSFDLKKSNGFLEWKKKK
jgi:hypothetical protein